MSDTADIDRIGDLPLPRERRRLVGHGPAEAHISEGFDLGRLHHAWLIDGPRGIGKATLAFRAARYVLSSRPKPPGRTLDLDLSDPVFRLVEGLAHPDFMLVRRAINPDTDKVRETISVDDVRRLSHVFGETAALGGWRVCVVDSVDDMTTAASNALLKLLEEPPRQTVFFLVTHQHARVLATIRSRCRRLTLKPLGRDDLQDVLAELLPQSAPADRADAALRANGSVRAALELIDEDRLVAVRKIEQALSQVLDVKSAHQFAEQMARKGADADFDAFIKVLRERIAQAVTSGVRAGVPLSALSRLAELDVELAHDAQVTDVFNLDKKSFVLSALRRWARAGLPNANST